MIFSFIYLFFSKFPIINIFCFIIRTNEYNFILNKKQNNGVEDRNLPYRKTLKSTVQLVKTFST